MSKTSKIIKIYCNEVLGGWSPDDEYQTSASELGMRELAFEFAKFGHKVTVYHNRKHGNYNGVSFVDFDEFNAFEECDVFISFKNKEVWEQTIEAPVRLHFSTEIDSFDNSQIQKYIVISEYHKKRAIETNKDIEKKIEIIPVGTTYRDNNTPKGSGALYSSSPDRGLIDIVSTWNASYPQITVTFGWDKFELYNAHNRMSMLFRDEAIRRLTAVGAIQAGKLSIKEMDREYARARYWVYPLAKDIPDSELMCQSAIYAQLYWCTPVIRPLGALPETVLHYIEWDKWDGKETLSEKELEDNFIHAQKWLWKSVIGKWIELIESIHPN